MITVDVYVPYLNASYDFSLDETAPIETVVEEVTSLVCLKEHWPAPSQTNRLGLYGPARKRCLLYSHSLSRAGIHSGQRLILC